MASFVLRGDICWSRSPKQLEALEDGYLVCEDGLCRGVFRALPERYAGLEVTDFSGKLIIPGLIDLHTHASQYAGRALGLDMELIGWLNAYTFPEESKFSDIEYARAVYGAFAAELRAGATTRAAVFATLHTAPTLELMRVLEATGLVTLVGKVSMDRNCPDILTEHGFAEAAANAAEWLEQSRGFSSTRPIITPRFIPSCSDELMRELKKLQTRYDLPVQSHLSENRSEIEWVRELCPGSASYGGAYDSFGMFGGGTKTIMAHCVWCAGDEVDLLIRRGVFIAHCPQSNINLSSGIAPARAFLDLGARMGLGSDAAGGCHLSIFRAMTDAIQVSKLYSVYVDPSKPPLTVAEAFYLGTLGGGGFFGNVGAFEPGYEFDAVVIDDGALRRAADSPITERLTKAVYLSDDRHIRAKFVRGVRLF